MKIIQIVDNLGAGGGVNSFVYDLCYALKEQGCDVSLVGILSKGYHQNPEIEKLRSVGIRVDCIGSESKKDALLHNIEKLKLVIADIAGIEPTICNLHLKLSVLMGVIATRGLKNIWCVETYHSQYSNYWLQVKILSSFISMYIPCSESAKIEFLQRFHPKSYKVTAIANGVNSQKLRTLAMKNKPDSIIKAISVGRFTKQKNLHITAESFSKIENKNFLYKIFGEGDLKQEIINASGNSEKVVLCGAVSRETIINELANCDIVVMPSLWEGLSIFMLEALALNCPMMISDIPSLRNIFGDKPLGNHESWRQCAWGYLVETSNISAYTAAMNHFLNNQNLVPQMRKAIEDISTMYSIESTAKQYISVYNQCLEREN